MSINATDLRLPGWLSAFTLICSGTAALIRESKRWGGRGGVSRDLSVTPLRWHLRVGCVSSPRHTCTPARRQASEIKWEVNGSASPGFHAATFDTDVTFRQRCCQRKRELLRRLGWDTNVILLALSELSAGENLPFFLAVSSNLKTNISSACVLMEYTVCGFWFFWGTITKHYMACCPSFSNFNQLLTLQNDSFIHVQISIDFFFGELFNLTGKILKV